ncbi:MAG: hypothetical protein IPJ62_19745 [Betaproteobacteria bacterium]|nr:hypothetical protein [Betaproteobacteria bacterium]
MCKDSASHVTAKLPLHASRHPPSIFVALATVGKPGLEVRPKLFVNTGDNIEIDTCTGEYRRRVQACPARILRAPRLR